MSRIKTGPTNSITDIAGLLVGHAQDDRVKTGVTVLTAEAPFAAGVHVMGGAPGTRETDLLAPDKTVQQVDALVLSGGSSFGLAAAGGVADAMRKDGRGFLVGDQNVPIVPGAIIFDLLNGGDKGWTDNPYSALGAKAYANRTNQTALGTVGAGTGATTATLKGGLGTASTVLPSGHSVGALVVVNALGSATLPDQPHFWAAPWELGDEYGGLGAGSHDPATPPLIKGAAPQNTTIAIVATDAALDQAQCTRLATAAHDGMARALLPSHTPMDGDLVFAAATGTKPLTGPEDMIWLCHYASTTLARAIARGVYAAAPAPNDLLPSWVELRDKAPQG